MPGVGGGHRGGGGGGGFGGGRPGGGGGFGGGRPGGGFGGGPRPGGFGGGPRPGGFGGPHWHHRPPRPHRPFWGPGWGWGPRYGGYGGGCGSFAASIILVPVFLILFLILMFSNNGVHVEYTDTYPEPDIAITESTRVREAMDSKYIIPIDDYYYDDMGLINTAAAQFSLENSLKDFYLKTGVQPYLYIADDLDGNTNPNKDDVDAFLLAKYNELFEDEGHFMVLYYEYESGEYNTWYVYGNDAHRYVMDDEACEIVLYYIDYYYSSPSTADYTDMFCSAFDAASARIMGGKTRSEGGIDWGKIIIALIVTVAGVVLIVYIVKRYRNTKPGGDGENGTPGSSDNMSEEDKRKEKYRRKYGG
ncbi:MAG: hypothetical protein IJY27_03405 [Clostridia bacterium]|nr:hypothetical protein [Clostridia bacterium]